jgi:hypothetical protein
LLCDDKPSDDENEHHINRVVIDEEDGDDRDVKLVKLVTQYMASPAPEFKVVSTDHQHRCND